jgi:hypothetical protein
MLAEALRADVEAHITQFAAEREREWATGDVQEVLDAFQA